MTVGVIILEKLMEKIFCFASKLALLILKFNLILLYSYRVQCILVNKKFKYKILYLNTKYSKNSDMLKILVSWFFNSTDIEGLNNRSE